MKNTWLYTAVLATALCATDRAEAELFVGHGIDLSNYSSVSGGYTTFGASTEISDTIGATSYITLGEQAITQDINAHAITLGAAAISNDIYTNTLVAGAGATYNSVNQQTNDVQAAMLQLSQAQNTLNSLDIDHELLATTTGGIFNPGIYHATALTSAAGSTITLDGLGEENPFWVFNLDTYLVTGAGTSIEIVNAGQGASVIWNTGSYISMGADTAFLGSAFSGGYVSGGAGAGVTCGNLFAKSYITLGANVDFTSTNCTGTRSWSGLTEGLGSRFDIIDGVAYNQVASVPVPPAGIVFASVLLILGIRRKLQKQSASRTSRHS